MMRARSFLIVVAFLSALSVGAQPGLPPAKRVATSEKAPLINAEAKNVINAMLAKYVDLKSYSDQTDVNMEGGTQLPEEISESFPLKGTLAWQRPAKLRFEGTIGTRKFLALSDDNTLRAINPEHPGLWLECSQHPLTVATKPDGTKFTLPPDNTPAPLDAAVSESNALLFGLPFMTDSSLWTRTMKDVTALTPEPDAQVKGTVCRVVKVQSQSDQGDTSLMHLWIARDDNMLRRLEMSYDQIGPKLKIVETHTQVRANPDLSEATWTFQPPEGAKSIEFFPDSNPHQFDPAIKVGNALPTFSGDDVKGEPLELNSKSGKVTIVQFL